ncbi:MAG TPA: hypothetical protein PK435_14250 [Thermoanaerobaculaceae bacterium]|nr:hypothetical protein [Thermoanaerobaculaceae bacterium]
MQAKDDGLWFEPIHASEAYLQVALRALTKVAKAAVTAALQTER